MKDLFNHALKFNAYKTISKLVNILLTFLIGIIGIALIFSIDSILFFSYETHDTTKIKIEKTQASDCQYLGMITNCSVEFYDYNKVEMRKSQI